MINNEIIMILWWLIMIIHDGAPNSWSIKWLIKVFYDLNKLEMVHLIAKKSCIYPKEVQYFLFFIPLTYHKKLYQSFD